MSTTELAGEINIDDIKPGTRAAELHELWLLLCDVIDGLNGLECYEAQTLAERAHKQICRDLKFELEDERARDSN